jgi:hypothetical protein
MSSLKREIERIESMMTVPEHARVFAQVVARFGMIDPKGWSGGGVEVARLPGEDDPALMQRAGVAVLDQLKTTEKIMAAMGEVLPG